MNEEQNLFGQIVLLMLKRQEQWVRGATERELKLYSAILNLFPDPYTSDELDELLKTNRDQFSTGRRFVFLEPMKDGILPMLTFRYDFTADVPIVSLQIGMFKLNANKPVALGFRFEVPEGEGNHNYYHAQAIDTLRNGGLRLPCRPLVSATWPTFTLNALNVGTLLLCAIVSLYGRDKLADFQSAGLGSLLVRYMRDLHWNDPNNKKGNRFKYDACGRWWQAPKV
jgi:hypothetical protein